MARPFHFTTDPSSLWTAFDLGGSSSIVQSGTILTFGGNFETVFIRDTDTSNNTTVEARQQHDWISNNEGFGVVANFQSSSQWYLFGWFRFAGGGDQRLRLFVFNSGFTQLSNVTENYTANTDTNLKLTTKDNGANKDLEGFVDGVSKTTASTSTKYGTGRGGIYTRVINHDMIADWWAFDTVLAINSVTPNAGLFDETTPVVIDGNDFGDGTLVDVGVQAAQNIVVVSPTKITCDFPPATSEKVNVTVKFGTP